MFIFAHIHAQSAIGDLKKATQLAKQPKERQQLQEDLKQVCGDEFY